MTTTHYLHPSAKALTGARLGLGWLDRLEALGITRASAVPHHTHESMEVLCCLKGVIGYTFDRWPSVTMTADWLNRHRIRMAQKLLSTGDTTIAEAAHQVGFAELPFFFRLFRRHAGCSTAAYRRQSIASSVALR